MTYQFQPHELSAVMGSAVPLAPAFPRNRFSSGERRAWRRRRRLRALRSALSLGG